MNNSTENLLNILPVIIFLASYYAFGIIPATICLLVASILLMIVVYFLKRTISKVAIFSNALLAIFGGITVFSGNSAFIKIKPTILYLCLSCVLAYDIIAKKGLLKHVIGQNIKLDDGAYGVLSKQWLSFFLLCAALNEFIWRNFSESTWVSFKTFGMFGMLILFSVLQAFTLRKWMK